MDGKEFREVQRFKAWWIYLIMGALVVMAVGMAVYQVAFNEPVGNNPMSNMGVIFFAIVVTVFVVWLLSLRLRTHYDRAGIFLSFKPLTQRRFTWDEVEHLEIVDYGFVGYGIRWSRKYNVVYNAHGRIGLLLHLKDGKKICIGTQRSKELEAFLREIVPDKWTSQS